MKGNHSRFAPRWPYWAIAGVCFAVGIAAGWTPLATQIDNYHYDWTLRLYRPRLMAQDTVILAIDDATLNGYGGIRGMRRSLAQALPLVAAAKPKAVAVDLLLVEASDAADDALLAAALQQAPNLVLACDLAPETGLWQEPYAPFLRAARAVGHVHAYPDVYDGVSRQVQLEKVGGRTRRWALALEALRLAEGAGEIVESPEELQVGKRRIPVARRGEQGRPMYVRYRSQPIPRISVRQLLEQPATSKRLAGKVVFIGVTSQSEARDRLVTPYSTSIPMPGVEIHSHIYETLAQADFLRPASNVAVVGVGLILALTTASGFLLLAGWQGYALGAAQILLAHGLPHALFQADVVFPLLAPAACAWLTLIGCGAYQYLGVRRRLGKSEAERARYQQAIQFVSHEMRSPLTAIQGSSQLISRYNLSDEKRRQIAEMIHSESKRLARMIQTFLDVERLSEGQMELKRAPVPVDEVVLVCLERARPLAERKRIRLRAAALAPETVLGDRELMEYAVYNLLTNAVKYSPPETEVEVETRRQGDQLRIAVRDQGYGLDEKEVKRIFTKFYRTQRAEKSGEAGSGIGLSIVSQIVEHHGGRIEVVSAVNKGSCFTIVLPADEPARALETGR